ncbi:MAG: glycosyltransferase family 4 protein [Paludibacteraceae bacterium]|nr:glycosyltransferase family 4 protein [Paludibacteraceae bacterium]
MKVVAFHLFNDYSGSPKVLKMVLDGFLKRGYRVDVVSSKGGVLDELSSDGLKMFYYSYKFSINPIVTMLRYTYAQLYTFFFSWRYLFQKDIVFYINTILPIGAALAGKLMGKRVVYHYHEDATTKSRLYVGLAKMMQWIADDIICVSSYQRSFLKREERVYVVPNALPQSYTQSTEVEAYNAFSRKTVLFVASLKKYKGILQFVTLASEMPAYRFVAVLNDESETIERFMKNEGVDLPGNLTIYPRQDQVQPFYQQASILLNLSNPKEFVETFGLTVLEAMSYGLPVIVPTKGGVAELVKDGENGYKIDVDELLEIKKRIELILGDYSVYEPMSASSFRKSRDYSEESVLTRLFEIMEKKS